MVMCVGEGCEEFYSIKFMLKETNSFKSIMADL